MNAESTGEAVVKWYAELGVQPDDPIQQEELKGAFSDPVLKSAWQHLIKHVRPKQEAEIVNQTVADYEFLKIQHPSDSEVELDVSMRKPEDVALFKRREKLKTTLQEKRKEEKKIDGEIRQAELHLKKERLLQLSLEKTITCKEQKMHALELKLDETKQLIEKMNDDYVCLNSVFDWGDIVDEEECLSDCLSLVRKSVKQLMIGSDEHFSDWNAEFWNSMRQELQKQPPAVVIQAVLLIFESFKDQTDAFFNNRSERHLVADYTPIKKEIERLESELKQAQADFDQARAEDKMLDQKLSKEKETLLEEVNQFLMAQGLNPDIRRIKIEQMRKQLEAEEKEAELEYVNKLLADIEMNNKDADPVATRQEQKAGVESIISQIESQAHDIRKQLDHIQDMDRIFSNLKGAQDENAQLLKKLDSYERRDFKTKLEEVLTMLMALDDDCFANSVDKYPVDIGSVDFKQIRHNLSSFRMLKQIKPLPPIHNARDAAIPPCKLPAAVSEEEVEEINSRLETLKEAYHTLS